MHDISNDNGAVPERDGSHAPDAHGRAAMLLVESLLHGLIARSVISVQDAMEIVEVAADVDLEMTEERGVMSSTPHQSLGILAGVAASLNHDLPDN